MTVAVFAYGSLVSVRSAAATVGREDVEVRPATLRGHRRSFSLARDNRRCEKTFARRDDGSIPDVVLALNLEPGTDRDSVNGALLAVSGEELGRLDRREIRYRRIDVTERFGGDVTAAFARIDTYVARPEHHAPEPPDGAVILRSYEDAVEAAFAGLGTGELDRYRSGTVPCRAERIDAYLVSGSIPAGNPRAW